MAEPLTISPTAKFEDDEDFSPIVVLKFADSAIPVFKESRNKDYIKYGERNDYPEYLTRLFDKSGKHGAIVGGKAKYIFGKGFENGNFIVNRLGESLNDVIKKATLDVEIYGGFRLEVIWNRAGKIGEIYHVDWGTLRVGKEGGFYWKECWTVKGMNGLSADNTREPETFIPAYDPKEPYGSQIYSYNEYRPGQRYYPLPEYIACNNYIETDIEISKFYLSSIRNGMMPSKMLQFYMGDPGEEKKKALEKSFARKFAGAENAGKFVLVFNAGGKDKTVDVQDLSGSELDKMFVELNKTVQQEIFSGHKVTSPMLFGIKTEGQLGGNTELQLAYTIFRSTYADPKAEAIDKEVSYLMSFSMYPGQYELTPTDPVGIQIDIKDIINSLPKAFVFEKVGVPRDQWALPNVGSDNKASDPTQPIAAPAVAPGEQAAVNEAIKNLTAKQHQQVMRIMRQHAKGQLTDIAAKALLRTGYGLGENDINELLGIQSVAAAAFEDMTEDERTDAVVAMFDACGDAKDDFEIIKSKKVLFSSEEEAAEDEPIFMQAAFKTYDVTATENKILELIKKDKRITPDVIAQTIGQTKGYVEAKIASLEKRGLLDSSTTMDGADEIIERVVPEASDITAPPPTSKIPPTQIYVKYSYEVKPGIGPSVIPTTRPFCRKMVALNRLYSRADIEKISARLGYSVFDRKGGWWGDKPECRHRWVSHVVVKKGGDK
jgi:hypothetical protein